MLSDTTYPGDYCCRVYEDFNYKGESQLFCYDIEKLGKSDTKMWHLGGHLYENNAKSWSCGKHVSYEFCRLNSNGNCEHNNGWSGAGSAKSSSSVIDRKWLDMGTLNMRYYDATKLGAVTIFHDNNCTGVFADF